MPRSLFDWFAELMRAVYPDDWRRFCDLARSIECDLSLTDEEAARRLLRRYGRIEPRELAGVWRRPAQEYEEGRKLVERFADAFRNRTVGRVKGTRETKPLEPGLIEPEALRFDPDELQRIPVIWQHSLHVCNNGRIPAV
jgi:hypothetical protein